ncbi:MAG: DUF2062 domain-containing protein [Rhodospirillales bacterium]
MFRRRFKMSVPDRLREFLWPRSGWERSARYIFHRVARLPGTPHAIAGGFACGAAISFTPFVGLHIVLAALLAWSIRANIISSAIGTVVGNPWSFPFIWVWIYELGHWMGVGTGGHSKENLDFIGLFGKMLEAVLRLDAGYLFETAWPVFLPMLAGGIPTALVVWLAFYVPLKPVVATYQKRRRARRDRRRLRRQAKGMERQR